MDRLRLRRVFLARVAHLIVHTLGLPVFRTVAFTVGFLAQAVLALALAIFHGQPSGVHLLPSSSGALRGHSGILRFPVGLW